MPTSKDKPGRFAVRALKWLAAAALALALLAGAGWGFLEWRFGYPTDPNAAVLLMRLQDEAVPPGPREGDAWPIYRQIITEDFAIADFALGWEDRANDLYQRAARRQRDARRVSYSGGEWSDPVFDPMRGLLADLQPVFARFDQAASRPFCRFPIHTEGDELSGTRTPGVARSYNDFVMFEVGTPLLHLHSMAMASMRDHASRGEWDAVRHRAGSIVASTRHSRTGRGFWATVSMTTESSLYSWLWRLAREFEADAAEIDRLIAFIEGLDPPRPVGHLIKEQTLLVPGFVYLATPYFALFDPETWPDAWAGPRPHGLARELNRAIRQHYAQHTKPRHERAPITHNADDEDAPLVACKFLIDEWDRLAMTRRAALVGLRIERFQRTHGRWPLTLDEALPDPDLADFGGGMVFAYDPTPSTRWPYRLTGPEGMPYFLRKDRILTHDWGPAILPSRRPEADSTDPPAPPNE